MSKRILVTSNRLGQSNDELGAILMGHFFHALARSAEKPSAIMLANEGVRLACEGSEVLDDLRLLVEAGVPVKACGTCLDFLGITDSLMIGDVGTMTEAVGAFLADDEIVTIA